MARIRLSPSRCKRVSDATGEVGAAIDANITILINVPRRVRGASAGAVFEASPLTLTLSPRGEGIRVGLNGRHKIIGQLRQHCSIRSQFNRTALPLRRERN